MRLHSVLSATSLMKMLNGTDLSINTWDAPSVACLPQAFSRLSGLVKHDFSFVILWCLLVITSLFFTRKWFPRLVAPPLCQKSRWGWPACKFPRFLPFMSKGGAFTVLQFSGNFLTCNSLANIVRLRSATPKSLYTWECSVCLHTLSCSLSTKQVSLRSRFSHWSWAWDPEGRSYQ